MGDDECAGLTTCSAQCDNSWVFPSSVEDTWSRAWSPGHTCCVATCHPGHTCGHGDIGCVKDTDCNTGNILHCKFLQQIFINVGCTHTDGVTKCPFPFIYKEEHRNLGNRVNTGLSQGVEYDQCT